MHARVQRWGNSLAVRIPKPLAEQVGLEQGCLVDLQLEDRALSVRPVAPANYTFEVLIAGITDDNRHGEVDTGHAVGEEAW